MPGYTSPGAAFGSAMDNFLMQRAQEEHQQFLDDLATKREQRLAQAELDSKHEREQEMQRKVAKDKEDAHDRKAKDLEKRVSGMVKGDRPDPEMVQQAQELGMAGIFRQQAPAMSTDSMQPPAALTVSGTGPEAGSSTDEAAPVPGAMTPGPLVYPGSPKERADDDLRQRREAFIAKLPDDLRQEAQLAFEAESLGLKTPTGLLSKGSGAATKHRVVFDPKNGGRYLDGITHKPITDETDLENAQVDRLSDPATSNGVAEQRLQTTREHAYTEFKDASKPLLDRIDRADKLEASLNQHTDLADSTIAEQLVTLTAGGAGSGIRISQPMIDQVLNKSRTRWQDLEQSLKRWSVAPEDKKGNLGLFFTDDQRKAITDLGRAYRAEALKARKKILDYRRKIDDANDISTINHLRTQAQQDLFDPGDSTDSDAAPTPTRTRYDINGNVIK